MNSGDANMWYEHHPYKMEIVGSTPTSTTTFYSFHIIEIMWGLWCISKAPIFFY